MSDPTVVVIGAGPAGAATAIGLAARGVRTLLVERDEWPRYKVCGGCLNAAALEALHRLPLGSCAASDQREIFGAAALDHCTIHVRRMQRTLPMRASRVIDRSAFDAALVRAAIRAGAEFQPGTSASVEGVSDCEALVQLRTRGSQRQVRCRLAVVAGGLSSRALPTSIAPQLRTSARSRIGCGVTLHAETRASLAPGELAMAVGAAGYVGIVRTGDGSYAVAAALDPKAVRVAGGPGPCAADILCEACHDGNLPLHDPQCLQHAPWRGTAKLSCARTALAGDAWCTLGDASGYCEPFTGEGIGWALSSAELLVQLITEHPWSSVSASRWQRRAPAMRRRFRTCAMLATALRRPRLFSLLLRLTALHPSLPGSVLTRIGRTNSAVASRRGPDEATA